MMYGLYNDYGGWGAGSMMGLFGGGLMMIVFWAVFIGLIVWVVREVNGRNAASDSRALDILKERYAKGDISKEEFESKKRDIA
jgi:putative membrane protein